MKNEESKSQTMDKRTFEKIKVLDFTWAGVGPFSVNFLAYFGATVIKIENMSRPDVTRTNPPFKDGIPDLGHSLYFSYSHPVKKYDITLNLNHPKGVDLVKKLVLQADVFAESFLPGTMEKWGLGYEDLRRIKPNIIMFRTCSHGQTGSMAKHPGLGFTLTSLAGFNTVMGWPDRPPSELLGAYTDLVAPLFGGLCIIAALDYRRRTGKGQCLDFSQHEAAIQFLAPLVLDCAVNGREPNRGGNHCTHAAPHGGYRCQGDDRWCAISVFTDDEWRAFCKVTGHPEWTNDRRFGTLLSRKRNEEELDRLVEEWTRERSPEEVANLLQAVGVPAGVVSNAKDQREDPQLKHYRFFRELDHPSMGKLGFYHPPGFKLSGVAPEVSAPPVLGQDNEYVCTQILGLSDEEFVELIQDGVFS